jgi:hypothetical protein
MPTNLALAPPAPGARRRHGLQAQGGAARWVALAPGSPSTPQTRHLPLPRHIPAPPFAVDAQLTNTHPFLFAVVAPIRRYATSKLGHQYFDTLLRESQTEVARLQQELAAASQPAAGASGGGSGGGARTAAAQAAVKDAQAACDAIIRSPGA